MFGFLFKRHPLSETWIQFGRFERMWHQLSDSEGGSIKPATKPLREILRKQSHLLKRRGSCSALGVGDIVTSLNHVLLRFEREAHRLTLLSGARKNQTLNKALRTAQVLERNVRDLARDIARGGVKVSDPEYARTLPKVHHADYRTLLSPDGSPASVSLESWWEQVAPYIDQLPFFGQVVPSTSKRLPKRRRGQALDRNDYQRVLLSWLAGGSTSQKAQRVGVSPRSVYSCLRELIYAPDPDRLLPYWIELGLVAAMVVPRCLESDHTRWPQVVCLICHRVLCPYAWKPRTIHTGQLIKADPNRQLRYADLQIAAVESHAHLILHFELGETPLSNFWCESS